MASPREPFSIWNDPHSADQDDDDRIFDSDSLTDTEVADSVEQPDYDVKKLYSYDTYPSPHRHFSSATAIRIDDDPFTDDGEEAETSAYYPKVEVRYHHLEDDTISEGDDELSAHTQDERKLSSSQTVSSMPEDLEAPVARSPRPSSVLRSTPRSNPRRIADHQRLLSSPGRQERSPRPFSPATPRSSHDRFVSSPLARHTSGFRNSSSIRAMQMSSPSPPPNASPSFTQSPRSARQRRFEAEQQRSRSGTPSTHPNPSKEYPLILLHCSFTPIILDHPAQVLSAALPQWLLQNLSLLREKLNATVVDRGVLIPHPGEDYELLEERILESLELKKPRVGKCGHFVGSHNKEATAVEGDDEKTHIDFEHTHPACEICDKHIADDYRGAEGDTPLRRFELKIYASNGLMRAGAWSAAWREMEKIDVEIGVWMSEGLRQKLEQEAARYYDLWEGRGLERVRDLRMEMPFAPTPPPAVAQSEGGRVRQWGSNRKVTEIRAFDEATSTASCHKPKVRSVTETRYQQRSAPARPRSLHDQRAAQEQVPLSTLLTRFIRRKCKPSKELLLQVVVIMLAIVVFRQWWAPVAATPPLVPLASQMQPLHQVQRPASAASSSLAPETTTVTTTVTSTAMATTAFSVDGTEASFPVCTFSPSEAGYHGMAAIPLEMAEKILGEAGANAATDIGTSNSDNDSQAKENSSAEADDEAVYVETDQGSKSSQPDHRDGGRGVTLGLASGDDGMDALGD